MRKAIFLVLVLVLSFWPAQAVGPCAGGGVCTLADCALATLSAALTSINTDNTTVVCPAGSWTYASQLAYTATNTFTLMGQSTVATLNADGNPATFNDTTTIAQNSGTGTNPTIAITPVAGKFIRITGFHMLGDGATVTSSGFLNLSGNPQSTPCATSNGQCLRLDNNHFSGFKSGNVLSLVGGQIFGVMDHSLFDQTLGAVSNGLRISMASFGGYSDANGSWYIGPQWGSSQAFFVENNTFNYAFANDCAFGGREVFRHNTLNYAIIQSHETGDPLGCRSSELYYNNSTQSTASSSFNGFYYLRMGSILSFSNTVTGDSSTVAYSFHNDRSECDDEGHSQTPPPAGLGYPGNTCWAGVVNTAGTAVTYVSGTNFAGPGGGVPQATTPIVINGVQYTISSYNSSTSLTLSSSAGTQTGVAYYIASNWDENPGSSNGYPVFGQVGYGSGDLLHGNTFSKNLCNTQYPPGSTDCTNALYTGRWPHLVQEPAYEWLNTYTGFSGIFVIGTGTDGTIFQECRDYYRYSASYTGGSCSTGNGGGAGTLASRPATCATLSFYWATDTSSLYVCTATNTWTFYYTPYVYPNPLLGGSPASSPAMFAHGQPVLDSRPGGSPK